MRSFEEQLNDLEKALSAASLQLKQLPIWHQLLLATVLDTPNPESAPGQVYEAATRRWPRYYDFYELAVSRMVPRWGGSWALVERFARARAAGDGQGLGVSMYARLYGSLFLSNVDPRETELNWPLFKRSLDALIAAHPDATFKNLAVSTACLYADQQYLNESWNRVAPRELDRGVWLKGTDTQACARPAK